MVRYRTFQLRFTDADTCRDFPASYRAIAFELMRRNCKKEYLEAMIRLAEHDEIRAEEEFEKNRFELLQLEKEGKVLRSEVNSELNFPPNFDGLVLGCIDADFCK